SFSEEFRRDEISAISFGLVDEREVIVVTLNLPEGSSLHFSLPSVFEGFPVIIDYGTVIPFYRSYHEKLMPGISIGRLKNPPNAYQKKSKLDQKKSKPEEVFILTTKHGVGKK
ncbi:788_t:CDS:2, partial [Racocetra persica]